jgi:hypothetical protein
MKGDEVFDFPAENFLFYLKKLYSLKSVISILAVLILIYHEKIYIKLNLVKVEIEEKDKNE